MTGREKLLVNLLSWTALGVLLLLGASSYLDELSRLDSRFASLQKESSQIQMKLLQGTEASSDEAASLADRFWAKGTLPEPLALARQIKPVLDASGASIKEFQVVSSGPEGLVLKYVLEGSISSFLQAYLSLKASDPKLLVRKFAAVFRERGIYSLEWEVGYAALP